MVLSSLIVARYYGCANCFCPLGLVPAANGGAIIGTQRSGTPATEGIVHTAYRSRNVDSRETENFTTRDCASIGT
jgi:hypothetical protein